MVGLVSKTHAVLVGLKVFTGNIPPKQLVSTNRILNGLQRNAEELSSYQKKVIEIDSHMGIAIAGLSSDARVLSNFMKQQSLGSRMTYGRAIPLERIVNQIGERAQTNTQHYGKRPYGVGLLVAGVDDAGPHLFEFQPSGMTQEMLACAIGARSQMARTYLERNLAEFADCSREELINHGLKALRETLSQDKELTIDNTTVGVVGLVPFDQQQQQQQQLTASASASKGTKLENFKLYDGQDTAALLEALDGAAAEATEMEVDTQ